MQPMNLQTGTQVIVIDPTMTLETEELGSIGEASKARSDSPPGKVKRASAKKR